MQEGFLLMSEPGLGLIKLIVLVVAVDAYQFSLFVKSRWSKTRLRRA